MKAKRKRTPKPLKKTKLTGRDYELCIFLYKVKIARVGQIAAAMGMHPTHASSRLTDLKRAGLVSYNATLRTPVWHLTTEGMGFIGVDATGLRLPPIGAWSHELGVAGIAAAFKSLGHTIITAREILADTAFNSDLDLVGQTDPLRYPALLRTRISVRGEHHIPDLCIEAEDGWYAVEVELSRKGTSNVERIMRSYLDAAVDSIHPLRAVTYYASKSVMGSTTRKDGNPRATGLINARLLVKASGGRYSRDVENYVHLEDYNPADWGAITLGVDASA